MYGLNKIKAHFRLGHVPNSNLERLWNSLKMLWKVHVVDGKYHSSRLIRLKTDFSWFDFVSDIYSFSIDAPSMDR